MGLDTLSSFNMERACKFSLIGTDKGIICVALKIKLVMPYLQMELSSKQTYYQ
jgi:hypothetical protein